MPAARKGKFRAVGLVVRPHAPEVERRAKEVARWLARRLNEGLTFSLPLPDVPAPESDPVPEPNPNDGDAVCVLERGHCPIP